MNEDRSRSGQNDIELIHMEEELKEYVMHKKNVRKKHAQRARKIYYALAAALVALLIGEVLLGILALGIDWKIIGVLFALEACLGAVLHKLPIVFAGIMAMVELVAALFCNIFLPMLLGIALMLGILILLRFKDEAGL